VIFNQPEQQNRSDARVAALAAAIHDDTLVIREPADLFAPAAQARSRPATVLAVGVLAVGCIAALFVVFSDAHSIGGAPVAIAGPAAQTAAPAGAAPLELVALTSDRDVDRLVVRGAIHNPSAGAALTRLTAVVLLFDRNGASVADGRGNVDAATLAPGMVAPFTVALPATGAVSRYRISFRTTEPTDRIVPHVDRRPRAIAQVTQR
jgi:hypothetical protein